MQLSRHAREFYAVTLTTDPPVTAWEASFDGGATWAAGSRVGVTDEYRWLVAGNAAAVGAAVAVLAPGTHPVLTRTTSGVEIVVRNIPSITVT